MNESLLKVEIEILTEVHILNARYEVKNFINTHLNFKLLERMQIITAVSELARNIYKYAKSGTVEASIEQSSDGKGVKLVFQDNGPGIPDIAKAMTAKSVSQYNTGMGVGLSGSKNLADDFDIQSRTGIGTKITWVKWARKN
jgi:serine/threonine-protein kinase RsbT